MRILISLAMASTLVACSPQARWGTRAEYASDYRGYVLRKITDDPKDEARYLLRDPITQKKIRCAEELEPALDASRRTLTSVAHNENAVTVSTLSLFPLTGVGAGLGIGGQSIARQADWVYWIAASPFSRTLYKEGLMAFEEKRYAEAARVFERVLAKEQEHFFFGGKPLQKYGSRAHYYLALAYEQEHRRDEAAIAFSEFIERSWLRDAEAYDVAEKRLASIDASMLPPCRSREPVTFAWPAPR